MRSQGNSTIELLIIDLRYKKKISVKAISCWWVFFFMVLNTLISTDGIGVCFHSRGPEVSHWLPDTLPSAWSPGTQSCWRPQHPRCFLVHRRSHHPACSQHQSGGPTEKLLLWQEDHDHTCWIITTSEFWHGCLKFFVFNSDCVPKVS